MTDLLQGCSSLATTLLEPACYMLQGAFPTQLLQKQTSIASGPCHGTCAVFASSGECTFLYQNILAIVAICGKKY